MSDRYQDFSASVIGRQVTKLLGLPQPARLERYAEGAPLVEGTVAVGGRGRLADELPGILASLGLAVTTDTAGDDTFKGLVLDATGLTSSEQLTELRDLFTP